jgi:hypothetical protein
MAFLAGKDTFTPDLYVFIGQTTNELPGIREYIVSHSCPAGKVVLFSCFKRYVNADALYVGRDCTQLLKHEILPHEEQDYFVKETPAILFNLETDTLRYQIVLNSS